MIAAQRSVLLLALLASPGTGCALSVEGDLPEIEVTQHDLVIPGVPLEARIDEPSVSIPSFLQPHQHLTIDSSTYQSVKIKDIVITAKSGVDSLAFVHTMRATLNGLQGYFDGTPAVELGRYDRPATDAVGPSISAHNASPVEVVDIWRAPVSVLTLEVQGEVPEQAWTVDVTVRLSARLKY